MTILNIILTTILLANESLFAPTPMDVIVPALVAAEINSNDVIYDLGCGDGRVVITAAKLYGCNAVGIDIDESCVKNSEENVQLNDLKDLVTIKKGDVLKEDISKSTIVFVYLMPDLSKKLIGKLEGKRVIAHDKPIPGLKTIKEIEVMSKEDNRKHIIYVQTSR
jgi:hypothetical protein